MKIRLFGFLVFCLLAVPVHAGPYRDFNGQEKAISNFAGDGKWRVIMIWASDCHVCNQEAHTYSEFHEQHKDKDVRMLGISLDGKEKIDDARAFINRHKISFPNLIGEPEEVVVDYMKITGAEWVGTPTFLIYTPQGELVAKQEGAAPISLIVNFINSYSGK